MNQAGPNAPLLLDPSPAHCSARPIAHGSALLGLGSYVPEVAVANQEMAEALGTSDEWIRRRTGIERRHVLPSGRATSDMAAAAALRACRSAGLDPTEIELIVVATMTPDVGVPSTAALVQAHIGARAAAGFDVGSACAGFVHASMTADALLRTGRFTNALVIGADAMTRIVDPESRETAVLFGDGAGAVVLGARGGRAVLLDHLIGMDGAGADAITVPAGGSRLPASAATVASRQHFLQMQGNRVFRFASEILPRMVNEILARNGYTVDDVGLLVPHQANLRILEAAAERLGIPMERVAVDVDRRGNTGAGSIPLALERALSQRTIEPGALVCFAGFGAGLSWGASLMRWQ